MHLHILGICGTFMAGIAQLAIELGHHVTGSDANVYPPMSTFLEHQGIMIHEGYDIAQLDPTPELVLIGNALSRGNDAVEYVLDHHIPYRSGAQWLAEEVLQDRHVIAVSGTHGKTTTTSILTWILTQCGRQPGYLIGGMAQNFEHPAALGDGEYFVIEADEYDTAFFDKRSKFVHYRPDTLIINNLEHDHVDIFPDLEAIKRQFHHLLRTVPASGSVIFHAADEAIRDVLEQGCWSRCESFGFEQPCDWQLAAFNECAGTSFTLKNKRDDPVTVMSPLLGHHNALNASAALCAALSVGVPLSDALAALTSFGGVKRRLEIVGSVNGITLYDDFAHHPTAIQATLAALRGNVAGGRIICLVEPRSNTMRMGIHAGRIASALQQADLVFVYADAGLTWDPRALLDNVNGHSMSNIDDIINAVVAEAKVNDHIIMMSNGGFAGIQGRLLARLLETHGSN